MLLATNYRAFCQGLLNTPTPDYDTQFFNNYREVFYDKNNNEVADYRQATRWAVRNTVTGHTGASEPMTPERVYQLDAINAVNAGNACSIGSKPPSPSAAPEKAPESVISTADLPSKDAVSVSRAGRVPLGMPSRDAGAKREESPFTVTSMPNPALREDRSPPPLSAGKMSSKDERLEAPAFTILPPGRPRADAAGLERRYAATAARAHLDTLDQPALGERYGYDALRKLISLRVALMDTLESFLSGTDKDSLSSGHHYDGSVERRDEVRTRKANRLFGINEEGD